MKIPGQSGLIFQYRKINSGWPNFLFGFGVFYLKKPGV